MQKISKLIINGTPYELTVDTDTTLSKEGVPADGAAVGAAMGDLDAALDEILAIQAALIGGDSQ